MEIIVKINKLEDIYKLNNADGYLLANKHFSYRFDESFCINKIKAVKKHCQKNNKKVFILINKIFKNHELEKLKEFIIKVINLNVDGIYFTDFAVFMYAKELNFADKCYFYHETFLRNSKDIVTYQELGIKNIICSKDMNIEDIKKLPTNKKDAYGIICFGYIPLYESERKIITNYVNNYNLDKSIIDSKNLYLKENTRNEHYKVLQQEGISSIFNDKVLSYLPYMNELENNITTFIIDSLFFNSEYIYNVIDIFKNHKDEETLRKLDESIEFSDVFLNSRIGLM